MIYRNALRIAVVVFAGLAVGCGDSEHAHDGHDHDQPAAAEDSGHGHMDMEHEGGAEDAFAEMSPDDAKLAKAQGTCPVSGEELGGMGTPIKVMVGDRAVFLCCENCRKKLLKSPDKYLAKLGK